MAYYTAPSRERQVITREKLKGFALRASPFLPFKILLNGVELVATIAYFAIPKALDKDERYKNLSVEAKYLYGHMRETLKLSIKNNWRDKTGIFIKMARTTMSEILKKSLPTIRKIVAELVSVGLIIERRMGLTLCNRIYVQLLDGESLEGSESNQSSGKKLGFSPEGKHFAANNRNPKKPYSKEYERQRKTPIKGVLAQQYTQREYTGEELNALFEKI